MAIQPLRGMRDFLPEQMIRRQYLMDLIRAVFEDYGFSPMETPAMESMELLGRKGVGGEDVDNEIYTFRDKGDRRVGLRFDLTVPMARVVAANPQLKKPFKRYQISRVWRYDRPQAGRFREFWQADADIVGTRSMDAEAECLAIAVSVLRQLGFRKFRIRLNNRKILNGMVELLSVKKDRYPQVFRTLDKLDKIGKDGVRKELKGILKPKEIGMMMEFIERRGKPTSVMKRDLDVFTTTVGDKGREELLGIVEKAKAYGIDKLIEIDFSLVRGLDYYTGPIFEVSIESGNLGSVAGGGRYDNLIELYGGRWTPATGFSFGIERLFEIMEAEGMFTQPGTRTEFFVVAVDENCREEAIRVAEELRKAYLDTETDLMGRDMKKQLEYAAKSGIPYAVIVGEKEIKSKRFGFKDLRSGKQASMRVEEIIKHFGEGAGFKK
jgi:histidyl-tRNA synthetase